MRLILALFVVLVAAPAFAQFPFTADFSAGASPNAGFDGAVSGGAACGTTVTKTHVPSGGPNSSDAYQFDWVYDAAQQDAGNNWGGECYIGWGEDTGSVPSDGQSRYTRFVFRVDSSTNFRAVNPFDGGQPEPWTHKMIIAADGGSGRTIVDLLGDPDASTFTMRLADDGDTVGQITSLAKDTWHYIQTRTVIGTGTGAFYLWHNNNTFASPDITATGRTTPAAQYGLFALGYYNNRGVTSTGVVRLTFGHTAEYDDTFDASWNGSGAGGGGGGGLSAVRIRIRGDQ